jgi:hypothetical protein
MLRGCLVCYLMKHSAVFTLLLRSTCLSVLSHYFLVVVLLEDHLSLSTSGIQLFGFLVLGLQDSLHLIEFVHGVSYMTGLILHVLYLLGAGNESCLALVIRLIGYLQLWTHHHLHCIPRLEGAHIIRLLQLGIW